MKQKILFNALSVSIKEKIVFNQIKINNNFINYDKILITDKDKNYFNLKFKKIINYLEKKGDTF